MLIFAAILGALLGMTVRPALLAVAISVAVSGGLQGAIAWANPAQRALAERIEILVGKDVHALWPVLAAAVVGSIASAVMWSLANKESTDRYWFRGGDRRVVLMDQVEENDRHSIAEQRFRDILGR
jgi:hypothetical protein